MMSSSAMNILRENKKERSSCEYHFTKARWLMPRCICKLKHASSIKNKFHMSTGVCESFRKRFQFIYTVYLHIVTAIYCL